MYSIQFPDMFKSGGTNLLEDKQAVISNLRLAIISEKRGLFGDPKFGSNLKLYLFNQNNTILRDLIIDELYTIIKRYTPQIIVERKNIKIVTYKSNLLAKITCKYIKDESVDMFTIGLTEVQQ